MVLIGGYHGSFGLTPRLALSHYTHGMMVGTVQYGMVRCSVVKCGGVCADLHTISRSVWQRVRRDGI